MRKVCKVTVEPVTVPETNMLETVIGEEAQYVKAFDNEIVLCLESGTFPEGTPITIRKLQEDKAEKRRQGESSLRSIKFTYNGVMYEIDTGGIQPRKPLSIIIGYNSSSLGDLDPRKLGIYRQDDNDPSLWIYRGG